MQIASDRWPDFWKHTEWNELRARIVGNPPKITTWIKGVKFMEVTDTEKRLDDQGGIALQVHGGGDFRDHPAQRNIFRVKVLAARVKSLIGQRRSGARTCGVHHGRRVRGATEKRADGLRWLRLLLSC